MQVLCLPSSSPADVACPTCGQNFQLFWERSCPDERSETLRKILQELTGQHTSTQTGPAHPEAPFNIPSWSGLPRFSGAALLGGLPQDVHDIQDIAA